MKEKVIIFSAPSGSGKSTVVRHLLDTFDCFELSVSATSRAPRGVEQHGREYYFITPDEFRALIAEDAFVEHEEVYNGVFYGTLKKEVRRIWDAGHAILFDVDVKGGVNLKRYFGDKALSVFVQAPSVEVLRERLVSHWKKLMGFATVMIRALIVCLWPIVVCVEYLQKLITPKNAENAISREEVGAMADVAEESGELDEDENEIIQNLINIDDITASGMHRLSSTATTIRNTRQQVYS